MNWYRKSQQGEWWIIDNSAHFADANIGDINHSGMVIEDILSNYDLEPERFDLTKETPESLKQRGLTDEEIDVVLDKVDPRVYGMEKLGWKRVAGRNVQTQTLTEEDLKDIDYGLWDAYEQELEDDAIEFNIEVMGNKTYYSGVPYSVISTHNPLNLREYGRVYAKKEGWNKVAGKTYRDRQKTYSFNLSKWLRTAQVWNVATDDFDDKLKAVYELEYKRSMLKTMPFAGMPQRKENILKNIEDKLEEVIDKLRESLSEVFLNWLNNHALLSADTWANQRVSEFAGEIDMVFSGIVQEYARYALNSYPRTEQELNRIFIDLIRSALNRPENFPSLEPLFRNVLYEYKQRLEEELQSDGLKEFSRRWNKKFRAVEQAENFINNLTINDVDIEELIYFEKTEQFVSMLGNPEETAKEFYKVFVFTPWVDYWTAMGMESTRETIENIYGQLTAIDYRNMGNAIAVINLAINATHQNGDMLDYITEREGGDIDSDYIKGIMQQLTNGVFIEEWNEELREIGVQVNYPRINSWACLVAGTKRLGG